MKKVMRFTRFRYLAFALSAGLIVAMFAATFAQGGFNLGIDFQAGLNQRVRIERTDVGVPELRDALDGIEGVLIQRVGSADAGQYMIRVKDSGEDQGFSIAMADRIREALEGAYGADDIEVLQSDYVGPRFSADIARQTLLLVALAVVLILIYLSFRFRFTYAVSAVVATLHDALFMVAFIGAVQFEITTATIAAVLTIVGYSLNDTIVIFDRVRENAVLMRESRYEDIVNTSITQSMSRTIITSLTTLLAVLAIWFFATGQVQLFAADLIVGILVGTYSTIFIASPMSVMLHDSAQKRRRRKESELYGHGTGAARKGTASAKNPEKRPPAAASEAAPTEAAQPETAAPETRPEGQEKVRSGAPAHHSGGSRGSNVKKKKKKKK